jgi:hypothetical protein
LTVAVNVANNESTTYQQPISKQSANLKKRLFSGENRVFPGKLGMLESTRNQVPGNRLRVRIPCPPLLKALRVNELRNASFCDVL